MRPIVFLDIDGVLNHEALYRANELRRGKTSPPDWIDRTCVDRLNRLLRLPRAAIVISSSWRTYRDIPGTCFDGWAGVAQVLIECGLMPMSVIDATPDHAPDRHITRPDAQTTAVTRCGEIRAWLATHPAVTDFVALDDLDLLDVPSGRFVRTDIAVGLTDADIDRAVAILTGVA